MNSLKLALIQFDVIKEHDIVDESVVNRPHFEFFLTYLDVADLIVGSYSVEDISKQLVIKEFPAENIEMLSKIIYAASQKHSIVAKFLPKIF